LYTGLELLSVESEASRLTTPICLREYGRALRHFGSQVVLRRLNSIMKRAIPIALLLLTAAGCAPKGQPPLTSPDGSLILVTSVENSHADPAAYLCVVFEIQDAKGKILHTENTHASDMSCWQMRWASNKQIVLQSSDVGTFRWSRQPDGTWKKE
jgi:hypothetical protein